MRIPARCELCHGRALIYCTIEHERYVVRYRRCDVCHETSKTIQMFLSSNSIIEVLPVDADTGRVIHTRRLTNDTTDY
jgi:hypothetical protein